MNQTIYTPKLCTRCILPETFPGITFNEEGICNHCQRYRGHKANRGKKEEYEKKFLNLLKKHCTPSSYDVLMAYSGGKDSTYTLNLFINKYKLRVLALTFDNTFISKQSFLNMTNVCGELGADHLIIRPDPEVLRKIFATAVHDQLYSAKTLERASTICTSCIGLVKAIILRTAIEKEIPFVGFGWSPGQAPVQASVMKTNASLMRTTQKAIYEPLHKIAGDAISPYFLTEKQFSEPEKFPWNIHPLAFLDYNEGEIIEKNKEIGWLKPNDTDPNSTNCLLNAFANHIHRERYGFHPYVWEIANMVRCGVMSRPEGIEKIYPPENTEMVAYARQRLQKH
jgi:tRNA(Ile)-lysidine synthase TilS/MesJ